MKGNVHGHQLFFSERFFITDDIICLRDIRLLKTFFAHVHIQHIWSDENICTNFMANDGSIVESGAVRQGNFRH